VKLRVAKKIARTPVAKLRWPTFWKAAAILGRRALRRRLKS
jgi:hypothetical protein